MKTKHWAVSVATVLVMGLAACERKEAPKPAAPERPGSASDALKNAGDALKETAREAGEAVKDAAQTAREEAVAAAQSAYDATRKELESLRARVAETSSAEKPVLERLADEARAELDRAQEKLEAMQDPNSDWQKIKDEFSAAMAKVREGIQSLASKLR